MSLLERLMTQCGLYQKDPETLEYNSSYITKLVNNYRSHKDILFIPNLLFYDNELKVRPEDEAYFMIDAKVLPNH